MKRISDSIKKFPLTFYPVCAIAFFIPLLPKLLPWLIVIAAVFFCIEENFKSVFKKIWRSKYAILFIAFFLLHVTGLSYSANFSFGLNDVGMKLSLIIFPLLLAGKKNSAKQYGKPVSQFFIAGCVLSSIILIARAGYLILFRDQNAFFYQSFSFYMHPAYLALYFDFGIAVILLSEKKENKFNRYQKIFLITLLSTAVILLSSKAGILGLVLVYLVSFIVLAIESKKLKFILFLLFAFAAIYFCLNYFMNENSNRFKTSEHVLEEKGLDKSSTESSTVRLLIWKEAFHTIKDHPVFGVGTGDIKDELFKAYQQNKISGALAKKLNAHNQFIQTTIALGLVGLLLLVASLTLPVIRAFFFRRWIYIVFLMLIIFNFLFESMLERQDGIMFYAFFNALLFYEMENNF